MAKVCMCVLVSIILDTGGVYDSCSMRFKVSKIMQFGSVGGIYIFPYINTCPPIICHSKMIFKCLCSKLSSFY